MPAIAVSSPRFMLSEESDHAESTQRGADASDTALISAVADRDQRAMQTLYTRHSVKIFRFISRIVNNPSLAEDLVSEVFLDVWRNADSFKARSQVTTWLLAWRSPATRCIRRSGGALMSKSMMRPWRQSRTRWRTKRRSRTERIATQSCRNA